MVKPTKFCEKTNIRKGAWSQEEDQKLRDYINRYGIWNWAQMPKPAGLLRSGKSSRLRWLNYLRPGIKRGNLCNEEVETILKMYELLGSQWSKIAASLPGRTDNEIKNYWHTHLKKKRSRNNLVPKTEPQATQITFILESIEVNGSSKPEFSLPENSPKPSNLEVSEAISSSLELSTDDLSSSSSNRMFETDNNESFDETYAEFKTCWESYGDYGYVAVSPPKWIQEPICTYVDSYDDCGNEIWNSF